MNVRSEENIGMNGIDIQNVDNFEYLGAYVKTSGEHRRLEQPYSQSKNSIYHTKDYYGAQTTSVTPGSDYTSHW